MLQISTGKLFSRPVRLENKLRGILYTNLVLDQDVTDTVVGRLTRSSELNKNPQSIIYEFTERIEAEASEPPVLVSHGASSYLQDMAVVFSFAMNCICTPDVDLARRLTNGQRGLSTGVSPNRLIRRVFDQDVWCQPNDSALFINFFEQLIGLHRKTYLAVMRTIRTYVTGLHRVADDLEIAYTLMVASVESLAQDFDGHEADWESVDQKKRIPIDLALTGAPDEVVARVRAAIVEVEHVALTRRFKEFVGAHVSPNYFVEGFHKEDHPIGRSELPEVLGLAYQARSSYVHNLKQLPDSLTTGHGFHESTLVDRTKMLTLQGLSRLMRNVIIEFVSRQPTVANEPYSYGLERAGVIQMRLAPEYWVGRSEGDISGAGRDKLEGFLEQLGLALLQSPGATISDLRSVLTKFALVAPQMNRAQRLPYLAIYLLFNDVAGQAAVVANSVDDFLNNELGHRSSESLVVHAIFSQAPPWPLEEHHQALQDYRRRRGAKTGIRFPRVFEAAISLELAERCRMEGKLEDCNEVIRAAAEDFPENETLRALSGSPKAEAPLRWRDLLLPTIEPSAISESSPTFPQKKLEQSPRKLGGQRRMLTLRPRMVKRSHNRRLRAAT